MKEYKKLVRIKYDNRSFDIFIDGNHRKFFLEVRIVDGKETYFYLNLKDYLYLDKIYNHKDNVLYSKKYKFPYKVIISASLALILTSSINLTGNHFKLQCDNKYVKSIDFESKDISQNRIVLGENEIVFDEDTKEIVLEEDFDINNELSQEEIIEGVGTYDIPFEDDEPEYYMVTEYLKSVYELDSYGVEKVTFDDVRKTFEHNQDIPDEYRGYVSEYIDLLEERLPEIDLRTFNENLKKMKFETIGLDDWYISYADAYISCLKDTTTLTFKSEYESEERKKACIIHELSHALRLGIFEVINEEEKMIYRLENDYRVGNYYVYGDYFNEGFNTIIHHYLLSDDYENFFEKESQHFSTGYDKTSIVYQILKLLDGKYNIYDFLNYDATKTETLLKEYGIAELIDLYDVLMVSLRNPDVNIIEESELMTTYEDILAELRFKQLKEKGLNYQQLTEVSHNFSTNDRFSTLLEEDFFSGDWTHYYNGEADMVTRTIVDFDEFGNQNIMEIEDFNPQILIYHDQFVVYDQKLYNNDGKRYPEIYLIATEENGTINYTLGLMKEENKYFDLLNSGIFELDESKSIYEPFIEKLGLANLNIKINFDNFVKTEMCQKLGEELINKLEMNDNKLR